jgi:glycosyltransferase involved in cell wall biosynthesis
MFVSRCGVELAKLPMRSRREPPDGRLRVLCIGRLSSEKGHRLLLEGFSGAIKAGVDAELRIVGEGPERAFLEQRVSELELDDRCSLPGSASEQEVLAELGSADVFVLSSFMEGLPVLLVEAMAVGIPVIAPRLAGIPELVLDGQTGLLFAPGDPSELAQGIASLANSPAERVRLAAAARQRVAADFDLDHSVELLWRRFHDVTGDAWSFVCRSP